MVKSISADDINEEYARTQRTQRGDVTVKFTREQAELLNTLLDDELADEDTQGYDARLFRNARARLELAIAQAKR